MGTTTTSIRHVDRGVLLAQFANEVFVVCPQCSGAAKAICGLGPVKGTT